MHRVCRWNGTHLSINQHCGICRVKQLTLPVLGTYAMPISPTIVPNNIQSRWDICMAVFLCFSRWPSYGYEVYHIARQHAHNLIDYYIRICQRANRKFPPFWIVMENLLMKRFPGPQRLQHYHNAQRVSVRTCRIQRLIFACIWIKELRSITQAADWYSHLITWTYHTYWQGWFSDCSQPMRDFVTTYLIGWTQT